MQIQTPMSEFYDEEEEDIVPVRLSTDEFYHIRGVYGTEKETFLAELRDKHIASTDRQAQIMEEAITRVEAELGQRGLAYTKERPRVVFLSRSAYNKIWDDEEKKNPSSNPDTLGRYIPNKNTVIIWYKTSRWGTDERNAEFLHTLTHELLHAYAFRRLQAYRKEGSGDPQVDAHRGGVSIWKLGRPDTALLRDVDEALTEDLAVDITNAVINENREHFQPDIFQNIRTVASRSRDSSLKTRVLQVCQERNVRWNYDMDKALQRDILHEVSADPDYQYAYPDKYQSYPKERDCLRHFISVLCAANPTYKPEDIRNMLYQSFFGGSLVGVGKLIDTTLGKGTFRLLAEGRYAELEERQKETTERHKPIRVRSKKKVGFVAEHEQGLRGLGLRPDDISKIVETKDWQANIRALFHLDEKSLRALYKLGFAGEELLAFTEDAVEKTAWLKDHYEKIAQRVSYPRDAARQAVVYLMQRSGWREPLEYFLQHEELPTYPYFFSNILGSPGWREKCTFLREHDVLRKHIWNIDALFDHEEWREQMMFLLDHEDLMDIAQYVFVGSDWREKAAFMLEHPHLKKKFGGYNRMELRRTMANTDWRDRLQDKL